MGLDTYCANNVSGVKRRRGEPLPPPCRGCTRVPAPGICENKACPQWQRWFAKSWENLRKYPRRQMEKTEPVGLIIGGRRYLHPEQLRAYLKKDPCGDCGCPRALCQSPCRAKRIWEEASKEGKYELENGSGRQTAAI